MRFVGRAEPGSPVEEGSLHLLRPLPSPRLDSLLFYLRLPLRIRREARRFRPDAIVAQGFEAGGHRGSFADGFLLMTALALSSVLVVLLFHHPDRDREETRRKA